MTGGLGLSPFTGTSHDTNQLPKPPKISRSKKNDVFLKPIKGSVWYIIYHRLSMFISASTKAYCPVFSYKLDKLVVRI